MNYTLFMPQFRECLTKKQRKKLQSKPWIAKGIDSR